MLILGLSAYDHDSAATLIRDGEIVAAAQEERFTRRKCDARFPGNAVAYCLGEAHITLADVDYVAFYDNPLIKLDRLLEANRTYAPRGVRSFLAAMPVWRKETPNLKATLKNELARHSGLHERALPQLLFTEHRQAQAASAFFPSPFQNAAVLCLDGAGTGGSVWLGADNTLTLQWQIDSPHLLDATDEAVLTLARTVQRELQQDYLCLAGGIALNCAVNGRLLGEASFKNIWIQPAAGDAGGALGAALSVWYEQLGNVRVAPDSTGSVRDFMQGSYLGPWFSTEGIVDFLDDINAPYKKLDDDTFYSELSTALAAGKVIGWFQGRMEFGSRSFEGRSIIGDPRSEKMQSLLNQKMKSRESSRPTDCSERVQAAHTETNPRFRQLQKYFEQKTDCSVLANTSFSVQGEPIVCTPDDAYRCFMRTEMDCLVLENIILYKHEQPLWEESAGWQKNVD